MVPHAIAGYSIFRLLFSHRMYPNLLRLDSRFCCFRTADAEPASAGFSTSDCFAASTQLPCSRGRMLGGGYDPSPLMLQRLPLPLLLLLPPLPSDHGCCVCMRRPRTVAVCARTLTPSSFLPACTYVRLPVRARPSVCVHVRLHSA
jgi:hypothetical protein